MSANLFVCGPRNPQRNGPGKIVINTTSRSDNWSKGLSPFFLGPVELYGGFTATNVENAWQYSKVYPEINGTRHVDENGDPNEYWWAWARAGWSSPYASRYPAGKGAIPLYSYWNGEKLPYIEARKKIYLPIYARAVVQSDAYRQLKQIYLESDPSTELWLWDFDGYDHRALNKTFQQVINDPEKTMGHAFVIAMLLTNIKEN